MKTKFLKLFVSMILVIALILPLSIEVIAKITATNVGTTQTFGISLLHESKILRDGSKLKFGYGVKTGDNNRNTYRIYAGNNDFESTIVCLQKNGKFPTEDSSSGNYQSLGNATAQTLTAAYSSINETKAKQILWLVNNAVLPEDSDTLKDIKLTKIFNNLIQSTSSTENALSLNDIKRYLTEDDLVFAYQCAIWECENPNSILGSVLQGTSDGTNWDGLVGNDRWGFRGKKGQYITEMIKYYVNHYSGTESLVHTGGGTIIVPKITVPTQTEYTKNGSRIYIGPFRIDSAVDGGRTADYLVNITFKDANGNTIYLSMDDGDYRLTKTANSSADPLKQTKEDLEGLENGFYIELRSNTTVRTIDIELPYMLASTSSTGTVWTSTSSATNMQPLLSISRTEQLLSDFKSASYTYTVNAPEQKIDVALRKHIALIQRKNNYDEWEIKYRGDQNGRTPNQVASTGTDAFNEYDYKHRKDPIEVQVGDRVIYGISLYNEGEAAVQIKQITDYLPTYGGLEFVRTSSELSYSGAINPRATSAGDKIIYSENAGYITQLDAGDSPYTFYIEFEVTESAKGKIVTNIAAITDMADESGNPLDSDCDSSKEAPALPTTDEEWENYSGNNNKADLTDSGYYYKGYEDDDDFEKITVPGSLDLALRKSITSINGQEKDREKLPDTSTLKDSDKTNNTSIFSDVKTPLQVQTGDIVVYTIRVFNEGDVDGYASKIDDILPEGLGYIVNHNINYENGWSFSGTVNRRKLSTIQNATGADRISVASFSRCGTVSTDEDVKNVEVITGPVTLSTTKLQNEKLDAFNKNNTANNGLTIKTVQVACVVLEGNDDTTLRNIAAITEYKDKNKNIVNPDFDSESNNDLSNFIEQNHQDDEDFEKLTLKKTVYDLALKKYVTEVRTATNESKTIATTQKRNLNVKNVTALKGRTSSEQKLDAIYDFGLGDNIEKSSRPVEVEKGDNVVYTIRIYNEGLTDATCKTLIDKVPTGLKFLPGTNINTTYGWGQATTNNDGTTIISSYLDGKTIPAFDASKEDEETQSSFDSATGIGKDHGLRYREVKVEFQVDTSNPSELMNIAEITADDGDDNDSEPNSKFTKNDDQDDDDYDVIIPKQYDLALKKFVSSLSDATNTNKTIPNEEKRTISVSDVTKLNNRAQNQSDTNATYTYENNLNKENVPVTVDEGDYVTYTIRVYNEGLTDSYATQIKDTFKSDELEFVDTQNNRNYGWGQATTSNGETTISTSYLDGKLIPAFLKDEELQSTLESGLGFDNGVFYREVKVELRVKTDEIKKIKNLAQISVDDGEDNDSKPDGRFDNNKPEDDEDADFIMPKEKYDLALKKFVSEIVENNIPSNQKRNLRVTNVDNLINRSTNNTDATYSFGTDKENNPVRVKYEDRVIYTIRVYNEGQIAAKVGELREIIPEGLELVEQSDSAINRKYNWQKITTNVNGWTNGVKTTYLQNTTLPAFNSTSTSNYDYNLSTGKGVDRGISFAEVKIEFEVITYKNEKIRNISEISIDDGDDIDSEPNKKFVDNNNQDDDDFDVILPEVYDLALKKYVSTVKDENGQTKTIPSSQKRNLRVTSVTEIENRDPDEVEHNATYNFGNSKDENPVTVQKGDSVIYTIRVYNEGTMDAKVEELIDFIPEFDISTQEDLNEVTEDDRTGLQFVADSAINQKYGWTKNDATANKRAGIRTTYFANTVIPAFDSTKKNQSNYNEDTGIGIDMGVSYVELEIEFKVITSLNKEITNIAEITADDDPSDCDDSIPDNDDSDEDDQDEDYILTTRFDLALRKFITQIENKEITDREPEVDSTVLDYDTTETTAKYTHTKEPVVVTKGQTVTYTIRVYNEGTIDGYVSEIKDDIPEGLTYLPNNATNKQFGWEMYDKDGNKTTDSSKAVTIKTSYGSKSNNSDKLLEKHINGDSLDYIDFMVAFEVTQENVTDGNKNIINTAEVTECTDKDGEIIKDIDSTPNNDNENEDDIDKEYLLLKYFDLSLLKYVSKVIVTENGVTKETQTNYNGTENPEPVVKVEINKKNLANTQVKYVYSIKVTNEGEIEGHAIEVKDRIPSGLAFYEEDNKEYKWKIGEDGIVTTDYLSEKLLQPGESQTIQIVLRWENSETNLGQKINTAEISKDDNPYGTPDIDSEPDNNKEGEDDQDTAPVILSITTGSTPMYIILTITIIAILGAGFYMIYKYVVKK